MQGLRSLRDGTMQAGAAQAQTGSWSFGNYGFGLNVYLPATSGFISNNSKRMDCNFRLTAVSTSSLALAAAFAWSIILGTERYDWFSEFVRADCILGDAVLPHFLPEDGQIIEKGDSIMVQTRNDEAVAKRIAILFQGEFIP